MTGKFYSHGKLLITGEYVVLDGAMALAIPSRFGQSLEIEANHDNKIHWTALDHKGNEWFKTSLILKGGELIFAEGNTHPTEPESRLLQVLTEALKLNSEVLNSQSGLNVTTKLEFPQNWGLGSSSTFINNVAQWFRIDPYELLKNTFGGSGYDIAAAQNEEPITFQLTKEKQSVLISNFDPSFKDQLFFVHLNRKQNSRASIAHYKAQSTARVNDTVARISALTDSFISCNNIEEFALLIEIHETLISKLINTPKVKSTQFPDFPGAIKSLGGWGGDFILATGGQDEMDYFREKGYTTIVSYEEMVKNKTPQV
ncbi:GHMP kinase [Antarcticibacterium arcticum]|uniref:GHMP kinase n=1 Tax=Antarcticibacterium arcticum TaxID=2585771 RepID=A0A5B8YMY9_9FLAO|nr:GYDIA family GHMP kinase [Antarcticibacterium arcticum]QED38197.1 GHMP kinase [Antarcticibacterium arcticum]